MNFKTMLPMLVHLANTYAGEGIPSPQWVALASTMGSEDSMAWEAYQECEFLRGADPECLPSEKLDRLSQYAVSSWLKATGWDWRKGMYS